MFTSPAHQLGTILRNIGTALILLIVPVVNVFAAIWLLVLYIQMIGRAQALARDAGAPPLARFAGLMIVVFFLGIVEAITFSILFVQSFWAAVYLYSGGMITPPFYISNAVTMGVSVLNTAVSLVSAILLIMAWQAMLEFFTGLPQGRARKKGMDGAGNAKLAGIIVLIGSLVGFVIDVLDLILLFIGAIMLLVGFFTTGSAFKLLAGEAADAAYYGSQPRPGSAGYRPPAGQGGWTGSTSGPGGPGPRTYSTQASTGAAARSPPYQPPDNYTMQPAPPSSDIPVATPPSPKKRRFCTFCGVELPNDDQLRYCPSCGAQL